MLIIQCDTINLVFLLPYKMAANSVVAWYYYDEILRHAHFLNSSIACSISARKKGFARLTCSWHLQHYVGDNMWMSLLSHAMSLISAFINRLIDTQLIELNCMGQKEGSGRYSKPVRFIPRFLAVFLKRRQRGSRLIGSCWNTNQLATCFV